MFFYRNTKTSSRGLALDEVKRFSAAKDDLLDYMETAMYLSDKGACLDVISWNRIVVSKKPMSMAIY